MAKWNALRGRAESKMRDVLDDDDVRRRAAEAARKAATYSSKGSDFLSEMGRRLDDRSAAPSAGRLEPDSARGSLAGARSEGAASIDPAGASKVAQLGSLRDAGFLSDDEVAFVTAKLASRG